jgi:transcriptional regulator with XRE-family HTH domain
MTPRPSNEAVVLTKALLRAAELLGLRRSELAKAVGVSEATLRRYVRGESFLRERTKQWELATMLVGAYRSASTLVGHNETLLKAWTSSYNNSLNSSPKDAALSVQGLSAVSNYLRQALSMV